MPALAGEVRIELLGRFGVVVGGREIAEDDWPTRRSRELVALLALSGERSSARDRVIEQLWPHLDARAGAANLRKAAHHARRALGDEEALVLRRERVELFPGREVEVDVTQFLREAERVLGESDAGSCARVAEAYTGELLPDSPYEAWAQEPRRQAHARVCELLRRAGQWVRLFEVEPTDERACRELMQEALDAKRRHVAIDLYERLRIAMVRELGMLPGADVRALYDRCTAGVGASEAVFVGREAELAAAADVLRDVAGGLTSALVVRGPSGIGKSAFCREVAGRARGDGWRVISVAARAAGEPYGPLGAIVEQLLVQGREALEALPPRSRSILAELTPLAPPSPPLEGALTRHQVVASLQRALEATATGTPTMVCVEDAHLLDEATAGALHLLVAGRAGAVLVVVACRSEWIRTSLPQGVVEMARGEHALPLELGPLPEQVVRTLVELAAPVPLPEADVARIVELVEGSPFFALELARATTPASSGGLPATIRQAVLRRLSGLGAGEIDPLAALAIAGEELDLATVLALTGMSEDEAFGLLDTALDLGILVVSGTRYRFRHELVRQALIDEIPGHRRLRLHRDAAERLAEVGAAPELIAEHWVIGGRPGEAVEWLLRAARRAVTVGAFADALVQVERALLERPARPEALQLRTEIIDAGCRYWAAGRSRFAAAGPSERPPS